MSAPILPGATIGVLGSGQLGRMLALAARRMGYRIHTFSPERDTPTGQVADREIVAAYDDLDAVRAFAAGVEVVTFEFENIPTATVEAISAYRARPARRRGAAYDAAPPAREDLPARRGLSRSRPSAQSAPWRTCATDWRRSAIPPC